VSFVWVPAAEASQPDHPIPQDNPEVVELILNPPPPLLLPDLRALPPFDLHLSFLDSRQRVRLRFANTIWNSGNGALEMHGETIQNSGNIEVTQRVFHTDETYETFDVGEFYFEDNHNHWHWTNFSVYRIWSLKDNLRFDQVVAGSEKVGYCLLDLIPYSDYIENPDAELKPASQREYHVCTWSRQGISADWTDTYKSHIPGQYVEITHLEDGVYALESIVDPSGVIVEANKSNNSTFVLFKLEDEEVALVELQDSSPKLEILYD
jgi:hypothetical protein